MWRGEVEMVKEKGDVVKMGIREEETREGRAKLHALL